MVGQITREDLEIRPEAVQTPSGSSQVTGGPEGCVHGNRSNEERTLWARAGGTA